MNNAYNKQLAPIINTIISFLVDMNSLTNIIFFSNKLTYANEFTYVIQENGINYSDDDLISARSLLSNINEKSFINPVNILESINF